MLQESGGRGVTRDIVLWVHRATGVVAWVIGAIALRLSATGRRPRDGLVGLHWSVLAVAITAAVWWPSDRRSCGGYGCSRSSPTAWRCLATSLPVSSRWAGSVSVSMGRAAPASRWSLRRSWSRLTVWCVSLRGRCPLWLGAFVRFARSAPALERAFPAQPVWYLQALGVHPDAQRRGTGAALLAAGLALVDADHAVCHLHTSDPANLNYYRRYGFELVGPGFPAGVGGPTYYGMTRPASKASLQRRETSG